LPRSIPEKRSRPGRRSGFTTGLVSARAWRGGDKIAGSRPRNGFTSCMASRHRSCSPPAGTISPVFGIARSLPIVDEDDMEAPRAVGAELDALLDVPRPRRTGDEVDRTRHSTALSQPIPTILIGGDHLIAPHYYDMGVGQE